jgi:hypothetical protein
MSDENKARIEAINLSIQSLDRHLKSLKEVRQDLRDVRLTTNPCNHEEYIVLVTDGGRILGSLVPLVRYHHFFCPICAREQRIPAHYGQENVSMPPARKVTHEEFYEAVRLFGK